MEKIPYDGNLTNDIKRTQEKFNIITYLKENKSEILLMLIMFALMAFTKAVTSLSLPSVIACYSYNFYLAYKRYIDAKEKFSEKKRDAKMRIKDLGITLNERKKMRKVLKRAKVFETKNIQDEMNQYIEHITSDIYYINSEDKINVLREIKSRFKYADGDLSVYSSALYKLLDEEMPSKQDMPVRQVLKLRNGTK